MRSNYRTAVDSSAQLIVPLDIAVLVVIQPVKSVVLSYGTRRPTCKLTNRILNLTLAGLHGRRSIPVAGKAWLSMVKLLVDVFIV